MPRVLVEGTLCCCWGQQSPQSLCLTLLWPHGLQPTRLLCPWDFPGKNTGMSCHFLLHIWQKILIALWFGIGVLVAYCFLFPTSFSRAAAFFFFFFFKFECIWFFFKNYLFFGCSGSSLLYAGFLCLWVGATLHWGTQASHCGGFSCCRAQALGRQDSVVTACGLSSCGAWALVAPRGMWSLPGPGR